MHTLYYTDVQNIQQNNRLNRYTKQQKSIFSAWTTTGGMSCLKWNDILLKFKFIAIWQILDFYFLEIEIQAIKMRADNYLFLYDWKILCYAIALFSMNDI